MGRAIVATFVCGIITAIACGSGDEAKIPSACAGAPEDAALQQPCLDGLPVDGLEAYGYTRVAVQDADETSVTLSVAPNPSGESGFVLRMSERHGGREGAACAYGLVVLEDCRMAEIAGVSVALSRSGASWVSGPFAYDLFLSSIRGDDLAAERALAKIVEAALSDAP